MTRRSDGVPTDEDNRDLVRRAQAGDRDAREECLRRNRPLARSWAKRYSLHYHTREDLTQEAMYEIDKTIDAFDPARGVKFSALASIYIRNRLRNCAANLERLIRVSRLTIMRHPDCELMRPVYSLDFADFGYENETLGDILPGREYAPDEGLDDDVREKLAAVRDGHLTDRERLVIRRRFDEGRTLTQVANELDVSKEWVRRIQDIAIRRMTVAMREATP